MTEPLYQTAPPRVLSVPQTPVPQTCFGVLNENGMPTDDELITDIPPDFGWMSGMELYISGFEMKQDDNPGKCLTILSPMRHYGTQPRLYPTDNFGWRHIPFIYSKWWNGVPRIRLMAIKPAHVTGKILIYHAPDATKFGVAGNPITTLPTTPSGRDHYLRGIKMEWDLGTSSEFVFDVPAFNVIPARPTWIPRIASQARVVPWSMPVSTYSFGVLFLQVSESLQPGNIYPDSIRILVFSSFPGSSFYTPTDGRHGSRSVVNILGLARTLPLDQTVVTSIEPNCP